jgi:osmotically-inducible protein OsmY
VGIVSRANLVQAIAVSGTKLAVPLSDAAIRDALIAYLNEQGWARTSLINPTVSGGIVDLWGIAASPSEQAAIRVAAESMPGVQAVNDHMMLRTLIWA